MLINLVKALWLHPLLVLLLLKILGSLCWRVIWRWKCKLYFLLLWNLLFLKIEYLQVVVNQGLTTCRLQGNDDLFKQFALLNWRRYWRWICKYFRLLRPVLFKLVSAIFISSWNVDSHVISPFLQVSFFWDFIVTWTAGDLLLNLLLRNGWFIILNLGGNFYMSFRKVVIQVPLGRETSIAMRCFTLVRSFASMESKVSLEVTFFKKRLLTVFNRASIIFLALVFVNMDLKALLPCVWFVTSTIRTDKFTDFEMDFEVVFEVTFRVKCFIAVRFWADKGFL